MAVKNLKRRESAYDQGWRAGANRDEFKNPFEPGSRDFENWEDGKNDGVRDLRQIGSVRAIREIGLE